MFLRYKKDFLFAVCVSSVLIVLNFVGIFDFFENKARDILFILRGSQVPSERIVIVAIDDKSIDIIGKWPFRRDFHAKVVRNLKEKGSKIIGFDVGFYEPSNFKEDDLAFAKALGEAGCVVLNSRYLQEEEEKESGIEIVEKKVAMEGYLHPLPMFEKNSLGAGLVNPILDDDGFWRKTWLLQKKLIFEETKELMPHFSVKVLASYLGIDIQKSKMDQKHNVLWLGRKKINLSNDGDMYINYAGPAKTFKRVSYVQILKGRFLERKPDFFKDKIVLIGATAFDLHDIFYTPFGQISGVEINANIINTVLNENYIEDISFGLGCLVVFIMSLFSSVILGRLALVKSIFILLSLSIFYFFIALFSFVKMNLFICIIPVLIAIFLIFITRLIEKYFFEERMKRKIKGVFVRYVSPGVVEEILKDADKLELGGKKQKATIFFSDIEGFTTISEKMSPQDLVSHLNEYFTNMVDIVFKYKGTLDKYIGDALMAVFGVPIEGEDDAENAVCAAWEMNLKMKELREKWTKESKPVFYVRMGLCTGEVLVGNIGSSKRMEYTTIGDTVNTASRLETYNKEVNTSILIDEETFQKAKNIAVVKPVGEIKIRGKGIPLKAYELIGLKK